MTAGSIDIYTLLRSAVVAGLTPDEIVAATTLGRLVDVAGAAALEERDPDVPPLARCVSDPEDAFLVSYVFSMAKIANRKLAKSALKPADVVGFFFEVEAALLWCDAARIARRCITVCLLADGPTPRVLDWNEDRGFDARASYPFLKGKRPAVGFSVGSGGAEATRVSFRRAGLTSNAGMWIVPSERVLPYKRMPPVSYASVPWLAYCESKRSSELR